MANRFDLSGRRALITGARRAIGRAIALGLAEQGAAVAIHHLAEPDEASAVVAEAQRRGAKAVAIAEDIGAVGAGKRLVEKARAALGGVDILVINASIEFITPYAEITPEAFAQQVDVNLRSTMELVQAAVPAMQAQRWGRVVAIGSIQQVKPHPGMFVYAATKAAQLNMMRNLARQAAGSGVTFNNLAPGAIATPRNAGQLSDPEYKARVEAQIPTRRLGTPEDLVGAAILLCSDAGSYINGADLFVDGGFHVS
ncbi:MAG: SDR family oxidoreductase [Alphaproteobacteria bacterium]|nr:SDR family oxidoreductase [Alphaproteobacteria bacterium]